MDESAVQVANLMISHLKSELGKNTARQSELAELTYTANAVVDATNLKFECYTEWVDIYFALHRLQHLLGAECYTGEFPPVVARYEECIQNAIRLQLLSIEMMGEIAYNRFARKKLKN